ncbi:hypothetical protein [Streptomyces sp. YU58]|uniref:hypothetical protein n=1 Tax=Streptomyces sp. SX92 TaxID=3158972 RepID=UPI0027B9AE59|nr:hypothetical protein [Streptomyces coralus]WLW53575.1 hypothetical protein QU709_20330 [Streptomyces coralus]
MRTLKIATVLIAVTLTMTGCSEGESKGGNSSSQGGTDEPCDKVLNTQTKEAMKRIADIPESTETKFIGDLRRTADELVAQHDSGTNNPNHDIEFCGAHRGSSGLPSVFVRFSLPEELPEQGRVASIYKEYEMGKMALGGIKVGVLYFECSNGKFAADSRTTVLLRGEVRSRYDVTESEDAARKDNLHIVYESSRALSNLLDCNSNSGLTGSFKMPPEV